MTIVAHLTDLHLIEDRHWLRDRWARARLSYLSFGRELNAARRRNRFSLALQTAYAANPDHLVITGDLTEDGVDAQFEVLAEILADCPIAPEKITLVPGNHDAYTSGDAWARALAGSLRRYAPTSAPGSIVRLRNAIILPLSTSVHQHWTRSAGRIDALDFRRIRACAIDCPDDCPIVLGQHHPPYAHALAAYQWIDGLQNHAHIAAALGRLPRVHVLHGHTHRASDRRLGNAAGIRAFAADAVVDNEAPLRLYELANGSILPLTRSTSPGGALSGSSRGG